MPSRTPNSRRRTNSKWGAPGFRVGNPANAIPLSQAADVLLQLEIHHNNNGRLFTASDIKNFSNYGKLPKEVLNGLAKKWKVRVNSEGFKAMVDFALTNIKVVATAQARKRPITTLNNARNPKHLAIYMKAGRNT